MRAQYSSGDSALIKTTFDRKFNKDIILNYLQSNDTRKVNAALLSIAQSGNHSFINYIFKTDFTKNAEYICFALGQLGPDSVSTSYLFPKFFSKNLAPQFRAFILKALGKTGNKETLEKLSEDYSKNDNALQYKGIAITLFDFYNRGIFDKNISAKILVNELTNKNFSIERKGQAAFAIYRMNLVNELKNVVTDALTKLAANNFVISEGNSLLQYLLESLRRAKYFPKNSTLFTNLIKYRNTLIRVEAAKALVCYKFESKRDILNYLLLLDDVNPNVSRQAAISIKEINVSEKIKNELGDELYKRLIGSGLSENTKGELLFSYLNLYPQSFSKVIETFEGKIRNEFLCKSASLFHDSISAFNYLTKSYTGGNEKEKINSMQYLLNFQHTFGTIPELSKVITDAMNSNSPALISISADGVDSTFIKNNYEELKRIILGQTLKYLNNPDYLESLQSLSSLAEKFGNEFHRKVLEVLVNSDIYSVRTYAKKKLNIEIADHQNNDSLFKLIWTDAFKYRYAEVMTNKGKFRINFTPWYAPVSVGNFCLLAGKKFFNNIIFHRVVPGFVIQGGDPTATGWGGPGYDIISEFSPLHYLPGTVGMASAGKDTEGSQWFVTTGDFPHLDGRYTIFGFIEEGMEVVNKTDQGDKIISVRLFH